VVAIFGSYLKVRTGLLVVYRPVPHGHDTVVRRGAGPPSAPSGSGGLALLAQRVHGAGEARHQALHSAREARHRRLEPTGELRQQHLPRRQLRELLDLLRPDLLALDDAQLDGRLVVELPAKSVSTFAAATGSWRPITSPVGPVKKPAMSGSSRSASARCASVFLTTTYSTPCLRSRARNCVICFTLMPVKSVR
jgi:hypothetical protein